MVPPWTVWGSDDRLIVAWRLAGVGGLLILGGPPFFAVVNHGVQINLVFGPMLGVGLIYLGCGWRSPKVHGFFGCTCSRRPQE